MNRLARSLLRLQQDLKKVDVRWALVGGFAMLLRVESRMTWDVDVVLAVEDDAEAQGVVRRLLEVGYRHAGFHVENEATGRLATVRLAVDDEAQTGVPLDLLFASSGIEREIVQAAEPLRAYPDLAIPVARIGHLLAMKLLAGRDQDRVDARRLAERASEGEIELARTAIASITHRGCNRGIDLDQALAEVLRPERSRRGHVPA